MASYKDAPPPYELVVTPAVRLSSVDFWPRCLNGALKAKYAHFQDFETLIGRANTWLQDHPQCEVLNCETLKKKCYSTDDVYNGSVLFRPRGSSATCIRGLRLWFWQRNRDTGLASVPQFLAYVDVVPACLNARHKDPQFELLSITLDKFNSRLMQCPLQGKILTVETVTVDIPKDMFDGNVEELTTLCYVPDRHKKHKLYFTRIFYTVGPPAGETIGVADFVPDQIRDTGMLHSKPEYAGFTSVFDKAARWIKDTGEIRVTNLQTLDTEYWKLSVRGQRLDTVNSFESRIEQRHRIIFLRVAYVRPMDSAFLPSSPVLIHCRTFIPKVIRDIGCCEGNFYYEDHEATLRRMRAWVNAAGARVLCTETVTVPEWFVGRKHTGEITVYNGDWYYESDGNGNNGPFRHKMIHMYRAYIIGPYQEPNPVDLPAPPIVESECSIL